MFILSMSLISKAFAPDSVFGRDSTNINLREDQWKKLKVLSEKTGATSSALIRKAIDAYLKQPK
jgi:Ribbon-helix-helix domain